jgi:hypothetical protein
MASVSAASASPTTTIFTQSRTIPVPPATSYASNGGGDGWDVAVSQDQVYNAFHHQVNLTIACHNLSDASVCAGWPKIITDSQGSHYTTSQHPGTYLDRGTGKLYVFVTRQQDQIAGVVCVDTSQPANPFCGFKPLTPPGQANLVSASPNRSQVSALSTPMLVGHRWYAFNYFGGQPGAGAGADNELLCFDLSTDAACTGQPFAVSIGPGTVASYNPSPVPATIGSQLIIPVVFSSAAAGNDELACFDTATQANCTGAWPVNTHLSFISYTGAPFPMLDAGGDVTGLCLAFSSDPCYALSGASAPTPPGLATTTGITDYLNGPAYVLGPRVYLTQGNITAGTGTVSCYDYSTSPTGPCPNFPKVLSGVSTNGAYTVTGDPQLPTCLWVNSDAGTEQIQNFDAYSGGPCSQGRVLASEFIVPQPQCIPSSYQSLQITAPTPGAYSSASVQFLDGDGNPIPGLSTEPFDSNGRVDLTGLDLNTSSGLPQFEITFNGWPPPSEAAPVDVMLSWTGTNDPACAPARPLTTDNAPSTWRNQPVTVNLTATDAGGSGIASTHYSIDGGPDQTGTDVTIPAPADHSNDGSHTISYYSVDNDANQESAHTATVLIDTTAPATTDDAPTGPQTSDVTVHLAASDPDNPDGSAASGVANTFYSVDGGPVQSGNAVTIPASSIGSHTIEYYSVDNAGNQEAPQYATVLMVQPQSQTITYTSQPSSPTYGGSYSVSATATSDLLVTFSIGVSSTPGACSILGQIVSFTGVGTCVIDANQDGAPNFLPAPVAQQTLQIAPAQISVNAQDATIAVGQTPTLSSWMSTTPPGMSGSARCWIAAATGSDTGTYPGALECDGGTLSAPDYTFVQGLPGTLMITPQAAQTITYKSSPPSSPTYGGSYAVTATASSGLTVTLSIDSASTPGACSLSGSTVSFTGVGTCIVDANQPGDKTRLAAPQVKQSFTVSPAPLTVTASSATIAAGSQVPAITPAYSGLAGGDTAANAVSTAPTCNTSATASSPAGTYPTSCSGGTFSADYAPHYVSGALSVVTGTIRTTTTVGVSPATVTVGQSVTLTATVTAGPPATPVNSGYVQFYVDAVPFGSPVAVNSTGVATLASSSIAAGTHAVTASYFGNAKLGPSAGGPKSLIVNKLASTTALQVPKGHASPGATVTFTATIKVGGQNAPSGTVVNFTVDGAQVGTGTVGSNGVATFSTNQLVGGTHVVTATLPSTPTVTGSSASQNLTVNCPGNSNDGVKCESLLADPSPAAGGTVHAGQVITIAAMDDSPIGTSGSTAPTALLSTGQSLAVTASVTSGQPANYVDSNGGSMATAHEALISITIPTGLAPGNYTILVTAYDGDGDSDQWLWPITVQ